jgi:hypothetical protein
VYTFVGPPPNSNESTKKSSFDPFGLSSPPSVWDGSPSATSVAAGENASVSVPRSCQTLPVSRYFVAPLAVSKTSESGIPLDSGFAAT